MTTSSRISMIAIIVLAAAVARADVLPPEVCPPSFAADSIPVSPACPGLGVNWFANPGAFGSMDWNDNVGNSAPGVGPWCARGQFNGTCDSDYNDFAMDINMNATGTSALLTYLQPISAYHDLLYLGNQLLFTGNVTAPFTQLTIATVPGQFLDFTLHDPLGDVFHTGAAYNNVDNSIHDWAVEIEPEPIPLEPTPEPASISLLGFALVGFAAVIWRRRRNA